MAFLSEKFFSKMAEKHDRFSLQAAIDFCVNSDESDYDPSVGALSRAIK